MIAEERIPSAVAERQRVDRAMAAAFTLPERALIEAHETLEAFDQPGLDGEPYRWCAYYSDPELVDMVNLLQVRFELWGFGDG